MRSYRPATSFRFAIFSPSYHTITNPSYYQSCPTRRQTPNTRPSERFVHQSQHTMTPHTFHNEATNCEIAIGWTPAIATYCAVVIKNTSGIPRTHEGVQLQPVLRATEGLPGQLRRLGAGADALRLRARAVRDGGLLRQDARPSHRARRDRRGEPTIADAVLDRIVHNAYRIELKGESQRKRNKPPPLDGGGDGNRAPA